MFLYFIIRLSISVYESMKQLFLETAGKYFHGVEDFSSKEIKFNRLELSSPTRKTFILFYLPQIKKPAFVIIFISWHDANTMLVTG